MVKDIWTCHFGMSRLCETIVNDELALPCVLVLPALALACYDGVRVRLEGDPKSSFQGLVNPTTGGGSMAGRSRRPLMTH